MNATPESRLTRKDETREALVDHALRLFEERGFSEVTTDEIARAAGVTQRTFFRHFPSKEAAAFGDHQRLQALVRLAFSGRPDGESPLTSVREAILALADEYEARRAFYVRQLRLARSEPPLAGYARSALQASWEETLTELVAARLDADPAVDLRPGVIAAAAVGALRSASAVWLARGARDSLIDLSNEALNLLGHFGLGRD